MCSAGSRLLAQETIADQLICKLKERMKNLRLGHSLDKCIDMGPIVDESQKKSIDEFVQHAKGEGAEVIFKNLLVLFLSCDLNKTCIPLISVCSIEIRGSYSIYSLRIRTVYKRQVFMYLFVPFFLILYTMNLL